MKNFTRSFFVAFALLVSVLPMAQAKQYCHEPLSQGGNTIYLTCEKLSDTYKMVIEADVELSGLGGSFVRLNDGNHDLREFLTLSPDNKTATIEFTSTTAPEIYTPLYVMMPGEVNFGMLTDIEWGLCVVDDTEYTITVIQPAEGGTISADVDKATYGTKVTLTATPNEGLMLDQWTVTDAGNNPVSVSRAGTFNMPQSNVTVTATFKDYVEIVPATFYGSYEDAKAVWDWSITRNADQTLSFALAWDQAVEGIVPQVNINNGAFAGMTINGNTAAYTTNNTYEDGETLPIFFYIAYAGGLTRIDVSYIVGSQNMDPNPPDPEDHTEYTITLIQPAEGGTIAADRAQATYRTKVTLTATPDEGLVVAEWIVLDAEEHAVPVENGMFSMPKSNVTVTAAFEEAPTIEAATFYGYEKQDVAMYNDIYKVTFEYAITRNVNRTLSFELSWSDYIPSVVPQIALDGATFTAMVNGALMDLRATYTSTATYEDGETLPIAFLVAYNEGSVRIDVSYVVGSENEKPEVPDDTENGIDTPSLHGRSGEVSKVIENGQIVIIKNGVRYNAIGAEIR